MSNVESVLFDWVFFQSEHSLIDLVPKEHNLVGPDDPSSIPLVIDERLLIGQLDIFPFIPIGQTWARERQFRNTPLAADSSQKIEPLVLENTDWAKLYSKRERRECSQTFRFKLTFGAEIYELSPLPVEKYLFPMAYF